MNRGAGLGDEIQTIPATGLPTEAEIEEEAALQKAADTQLADVRKAADSWRNGLGALLLLVATIFFIKGRESVFDISEGWRLFLACMLVLGFGAAVLGAWEAMRAAFGTYAIVSWNTILGEGGWASYQGSVAESAIGHLKVAKWATLAGLLGLVVAVLITWFAPEPNGPTLASVTTTSNQVLCGELTKGIAKGAPIQLKGKASIPLDEVFSFAIVDEC